MRQFVILEHRWDGLHYDFMVETAPGGPLQTWAVDGEPVAGIERRARLLPDHRRAYLTYEGEVSGGRGTVNRWDEGTCEVEEWGPEVVRLVLKGRQLAGPVELRCSPLEAGGLPSGIASASVAGRGSTWSFFLGKLSRRT